MGGSPPLTHRLKLAFAFGSTAESVIFTTTSGLLLIYYNQVRGAPAGLVGLALSFGMKMDASGRLVAPAGGPSPMSADDEDIDDEDEELAEAE